jgi:hypothetical protein
VCECGSVGVREGGTFHYILLTHSLNSGICLSVSVSVSVFAVVE